MHSRPAPGKRHVSCISTALINLFAETHQLLVSSGLSPCLEQHGRYARGRWRLEPDMPMPFLQCFANGGCSATRVLPRLGPLGAAILAMSCYISWARRRSFEDLHAKHTSSYHFLINSCSAPYTCRRSSAYCYYPRFYCSAVVL